MDIKAMEDRYECLAHDLCNLTREQFEELQELFELLNGNAYHAVKKGEKIDDESVKLAEKVAK